MHSNGSHFEFPLEEVMHSTVGRTSNYTFQKLLNLFLLWLLINILIHCTFICKHRNVTTKVLHPYKTLQMNLYLQ